ncbi:MAG: helix-turn-helix domain-containing protein, partial [Eubacteriales bacterium]
DINLPILTGLDIIEFTKSNFPDIVCIVLSGYNDFKYVQKALQLSVLDYLLKPIDTTELSQVLKNAWERKCVKKFSPTVISRNQNTSANTYYLAVICIDSYIGDDSQIIDDDIQTASYYSSYFQHILDLELVENNFWLIDGSFSREKFLMISLDTPDEAKFIFEKIYPKLNITNHSTTMIVDPKPIGIENVNSNSLKLRNEIKKIITLECSQLIFYPCIGYPHDIPTYHNEIQRLSKLFTSGDFTYFLNSLHAFINTWKEAALPQYYVMQLVDSILINCKSAIKTDAMKLPSSYLSDDIFAYAFTYESLYHNIKSVLELLYEENNNSDIESREVLLMKLDNYIQLHFREPINTQTLCAIFNFTPAYISKLFKDYKGVSPTSYVTQLRMDEAKKLLLESNMNVRDLSLHLGYDDPFYFSKLFKKLYGVSPKQYQKLVTP